MTELQEKWLQALESGEYLQGKNYMKRVMFDKNYYCCLGVACEVMGYEPEQFYLTEEQTKELGLFDNDGSFIESLEIDGMSYVSLAALNDRGYFSFKDIAKIIRDDPSNVFTIHPIIQDCSVESLIE